MAWSWSSPTIMPGLKAAIREVLPPQAVWQRCYVHFLRGRPGLRPALSFYRVPRQHHKHLKSANLVEQFS